MLFCSVIPGFFSFQKDILSRNGVTLFGSIKNPVILFNNVDLQLQHTKGQNFPSTPHMILVGKQTACLPQLPPMKSSQCSYFCIFVVFAGLNRELIFYPPLQGSRLYPNVPIQVVSGVQQLSELSPSPGSKRTK